MPRSNPVLVEVIDEPCVDLPLFLSFRLKIRQSISVNLHLYAKGIWHGLYLAGRTALNIMANPEWYKRTMAIEVVKLTNA